MSILITIFAILTSTIISFFYLKAPLDNKGIEGTQSVIIRLVAGIVFGFIISLLLKL